MTMQLESQQPISKTSKTKNFILPIALIVLSSTVLGGQFFLSPFEQNSSELHISKGTYPDRIEIRWIGDFSKVLSFSIRKKEKNSDGPWRKVHNQVQHLIIDEDVEPDIEYQYEVTYINEKGEIVVLRETGFSGKELESADFRLTISKGLFVDCIQIYYHLKNPLNFEKIKNIKVSRRLHKADDEWIEILDSLKGNVLVDDGVAPGIKYDYKIEITDIFGNTIELIDYGYRRKAEGKPVIQANVTRFLSPETVMLGWSELEGIEDYRIQIISAPKGIDLSTCCPDSTLLQYLLTEELVRDNFYIINLSEYNEKQFHYQWRVRGESGDLNTGYSDWINIRKNNKDKPSFKLWHRFNRKHENKTIEIINLLEKETYPINTDPIIAADLAILEFKCRRKEMVDFRPIQLKEDTEIIMPLKITIRRTEFQDTINFYSSKALLIDQIILLDKNGKIILKETEEKTIPAGCNELFTTEAVKELIDGKIHCYLGLKDPQSNQNFPVLVKLDLDTPPLLKHKKY